jgi:hypothetical protein
MEPKPFLPKWTHEKSLWKSCPKMFLFFSKSAQRKQSPNGRNLVTLARINVFIFFRFHDNLEAHLDSDEATFTKEAFLDLIEGSILRALF